MPRFAPRRRSVGAVLALSTVLLLAPLGTVSAASASTPNSTTTSATAATAIKPLEVYDWAEVYFGTGEIAQGETLQVTVSDLRTGRIITATLGDGAIVVPPIPEADRYGDTGFSIAIPADFPVGVHNLTIGTDEFDPIVIPITVTAGSGTPSATAPATDPAPSTDPATSTDQPSAPAPESGTPGAPGASPFEPPVPITVVYGVLGGIVGLIILTAIVRRIRKSDA